MFFRTVIVCLLCVCNHFFMTNTTSKIAKACLVQQKNTLFSAYLTSWIHSWVVEQVTVAVKKKLDLGSEVRESGKGSRDNRTWNPPFSSVKLLDVLRDLISLLVWRPKYDIQKQASLSAFFASLASQGYSSAKKELFGPL